MFILPVHSRNEVTVDSKTAIEKKSEFFSQKTVFLKDREINLSMK